MQRVKTICEHNESVVRVGGYRRNYNERFCSLQQATKFLLNEALYVSPT